MPKRIEKKNNKKGQKRRRNSDKSQASSRTSVKSKKTLSKRNDENTVTKSKQLENKLNEAKRRTNLSNNKPNELRRCQNGKPMPPLTVLERMFEDSDSDTVPDTDNVNSAKSCRTPTKQVPTTSEIISLSPRTVKEITSSLVNKISNITDPSDIFDVLPPPPIIPQKKERTSDTPYIVGCKDRPQLKRKLTTSFCIGDEYGINSKATNEENYPKRHKKSSKVVYISKSNFNAQSEQIARTLEEIDNGDSSNSSTETIPYNYYSCASNRSRTFSPLPSTSKDNDTIMKNEKLFNESMSPDKSSNSINNDSQADTEIITKTSNNETALNELIQTPSIEVTETKNEENIKVNNLLNSHDTIVIDDVYDSPKPNGNNHNNVHSNAEISEAKKKGTIEDNSIIDVDDYYASINFNINYQTSDDVTEIIDIDSLTQESNAVLKNHRASKNIDKLTVVKTSCGRASSDDLGTNVRNDDAIDLIEPTQESNPLINVHECTSNKKGHSNNAADSVIDITNQVIGNLQNLYRSNHVRNLEIPSVEDEAELDIQGNSVTNNNHTIDNGSCQNREHSHMQRIIKNCVREYEKLQSKYANMQMSCAKGIRNAFLGIATHLQDQQKNCPPVTHSQGSPRKSSATLNFGDCPICMDSLCNNSIASTTCGHLFCMECIRSALKTNGKKCPTCRTVLKGNKCYHQIFL